MAAHSGQGLPAAAPWPALPPPGQRLVTPGAEPFLLALFRLRGGFWDIEVGPGLFGWFGRRNFFRFVALIMGATAVRALTRGRALGVPLRNGFFRPIAQAPLAIPLPDTMPPRLDIRIQSLFLGLRRPLTGNRLARGAIAVGRTSFTWRTSPRGPP